MDYQNRKYVGGEAGTAAKRVVDSLVAVGFRILAR